MQGVVEAYDNATRKELATKGDIQDVYSEIQKVRNEIQDVRNEMQSVRNELMAAIFSNMKWLITAMIAQAALIIGVFGYLKG